MSVTTSRPSPRSSLEYPLHSPHSQVRSQHPLPASVQTSYPPATAPLQAAAPTSLAKQNSKQGNARPSSPVGYFGLILDPSDGHHAKNNWSSTGSVRSSAARSPRPVHFDNLTTPFQKQSEAIALSLKHTNDHKTPAPDHLPGDCAQGEKAGFPLGSFPPPERSGQVQRERLGFSVSAPSLLGGVWNGLPATLDGTLEMFSRSDDNLARLSAPSTPQPASLDSSDPAHRMKGQGYPRSSTLPNPAKDGDPMLLTAPYLVELLNGSTSSLLLLDVRTYKAYAESRIEKAVNLCIPTTLLKRPSFNVTKLSETFAKDEDKEKFAKWKDMKYIVVYDTDFKDFRDASTLTSLHTLNKFVWEGWKGQAYVLKGTPSNLYPFLLVLLTLLVFRWLYRVCGSISSKD